ncbi:DNA-binding IclR family transcriptional regulator [Rhodoligotrophos appendicifer]|uniref:IclR family transcriptional regulator n=1 Tax=Rhodoligotrophos appendicifer TaxID=987056 RepID=UPI00147948A1|nr:IclR family transcriptional regulator [Rhodoligotrophos appendicifer]
MGTRSERGTTSPPGVPLVRSVERAARLLRAFTPGQTHLSLADLSRQTQLDKSTARRLLHTLCVLQFVHYDEITQTYALAPALLTLVPAVDYGRELRDVAEPVLARLTELTGANAFLWSCFGGQALCLDRVKARDLQIEAQWSAIGTLIAPNCAGGPRVILAYLSEEERGRVLRGVLPKHTIFSRTDPAILEADARVIRDRGWELAVDDYIVGLAGLGVPVFDRSGRFIASISITTLSPRLPIENGEPRHLKAMLEAAAEIGARFQP